MHGIVPLRKSHDRFGLGLLGLQGGIESRRAGEIFQDGVGPAFNQADRRRISGSAKGGSCGGVGGRRLRWKRSRGLAKERDVTRGEDCDGKRQGEERGRQGFHDVIGVFGSGPEEGGLFAGFGFGTRKTYPIPRPDR